MASTEEHELMDSHSASRGWTSAGPSTANNSPLIVPALPTDQNGDVSEMPLNSSLGRSEGAQTSTSHRRKVQWVTNDEELHPHHTAVQMPSSAPPDDRGDYFSGATTGSNTPEWSTLNTPDASRPPSPGDHDVDIEEGEQDGLPTMHSSARKFNKQAAKLIGIHRARTAFMTSRKHGHEGVDPDQLREALASQALNQDHAGNGLNTTKPVTGTSGVLSSLLKLYDNPQTGHSATSSQATLVHGEEADHPLPESTRRPPSPFHDLSAFGSAVRKTADPFANAVKKTTDKVVSTVNSKDRPVAARSGGGVFGALQAGAMDLAGVASPLAATIKPSAERSGHKLSRFSLGGPEQKEDEEDSTGSPETGKSTPPSNQTLDPSRPFAGSARNKSNLSLSGLTDLFDPHRFQSESHVTRHYKTSGANTPNHEVPSYEKAMLHHQQHEKPQLASRKKKDKKKHEEIFITMHVAAILQRQDFILRLARALMMFGAPSHRFEGELQKTARILDIDVQVIYLMGFMILAFQDRDTHTSEIKIVKQNAGLNLHKLKSLAVLHWEVTHDKIGVQDASTEISRLMTAKPMWNKWWSIILGGFCSAFIGAASFNASFIDALISFPLGCSVIAVQVFVASRSEILANCFELFITALASFIAAALQSSGQFCYASVISSTIVLILPGWLVCCAALELQSRSIVTGSVRLIWSIIYSLFLGFGISIGATIWNGVAPNRLALPNDISCSAAHSIGDGLTPPWWKQTIPKWWAFFLVPAYSICLSLKNQARIKNKEFPTMILLACIGWTVNYFSGRAFPGRSDINSALGALAVSFAANLWGKLYVGSFIVAITAIMFQLPSGLGANGLLDFAVTSDQANYDFGSGLQVAQQLLTVSIGLVVGIIGGSVLVYPFSSKRAKTLMSF